jgi:hypothetical protein
MDRKVRKGKPASHNLYQPYIENTVLGNKNNVYEENVLNIF